MINFRFKISSFKVRKKILHLFLIGVLFAFGIGTALFRPATIFGTQAETEEIAAIQAVVESYHKALKTGDRESALELLSNEVMVLENGRIETAEEYVSHHLAADMEFSAAMVRKPNVVQTTVEGNMGWVISTSTSKGEFRGREINSTGAELMVLRKENGSWKIRVIHWSSRNNRT
jgi:ketosteroid isomerase-like protein